MSIKTEIARVTEFVCEGDCDNCRYMGEKYGDCNQPEKASEIIAIIVSSLPDMSEEEILLAKGVLPESIHSGRVPNWLVANERKTIQAHNAKIKKWLEG